MFNAQKIAQFCEVEKDGISFSVDVSDRGLTVAGVKVLEVGMYASTDNDADEGEEASYCDGDMYVAWDMEGLQNDETAQTTGVLLLRNIHSEDDVTAVMGQFYWEHAFDEQLRDILIDCGFSAETAGNVHTSEWGMQDEGRASYDAFGIADEIRKAITLTA